MAGDDFPLVFSGTKSIRQREKPRKKTAKAPGGYFLAAPPDGKKTNQLVHRLIEVFVKYMDNNVE